MRSAGGTGSVKSKLNKYGMTLAQDRVFKAMKRGCWICGATRRKDGRLLRLFTDHDHKDGRVRGRLCFRHNKYLVGRHRDGRLLKAAAEYLDSNFDGRRLVA